MAGDRWQARIVESEEPADGLWLGEIVFNSVRNSLGVMGDVWMSWFPNIDPDTGELVLPQYYAMTGRAGVVKTVEVNFNTLNLTIRPVYAPKYNSFNYEATGAFRSAYTPNEPIVTFSNTGSTCKYGPDELVNKGAPNSLENFAPDPFYANQTFDILLTTTQAEIPQPDCNGYIWKAEGSDIPYEFYIRVKPSDRISQAHAAKNKGDLQQTWNSVGREVINFTVPADKAISPNAGRGFGYRSWVFLPDIEKRNLTFSMIVFGRPGMRFSTRIGQPGNFQTFTTQIPASGYIHAAFPYRADRLKAEHYGKPLTVDWFYNWHYAEGVYTPNVEQYASIASLQVFDGHYLTYRLNPAYLAQEHERNYTRFYSQKNQRDIAYQFKHNVVFSHPMLSDAYDLVLKFPSGVEYRITEKNRYGFNVEFPETEAMSPVEFSYDIVITSQKTGLN